MCFISCQKSIVLQILILLLLGGFALCKNHKASFKWCSNSQKLFGWGKMTLMQFSSCKSDNERSKIKLTIIWHWIWWFLLCHCIFGITNFKIAKHSIEFCSIISGLSETIKLFLLSHHHSRQRGSDLHSIFNFTHSPVNYDFEINEKKKLKNYWHRPKTHCCHCWTGTAIRQENCYLIWIS